jgi:hypothetical protein
MTTQVRSRYFSIVPRHLPLGIRSAMSAGMSLANRDEAMRKAREPSTDAGMRQVLVKHARLQNHYMLAFLKIAKEVRS